MADLICRIMQKVSDLNNRNFHFLVQGKLGLVGKDRLGLGDVEDLEETSFGPWDRLGGNGLRVISTVFRLKY